MDTESKKIILIVEDDEAHKFAYEQTLNDAGFATIFATDGDKGISLAKNQQPNLILLDIMLAGQKNGFDTLKILKEDESTKNIPVIVITNLEDRHETEALELGAIKFFVKTNTSLSQIVETIKTII